MVAPLAGNDLRLLGLAAQPPVVARGLEAAVARLASARGEEKSVDRGIRPGRRAAPRARSRDDWSFRCTRSNSRASPSDRRQLPRAPSARGRRSRSIVRRARRCTPCRRRRRAAPPHRAPRHGRSCGARECAAGGSDARGRAPGARSSRRRMRLPWESLRLSIHSAAHREAARRPMGRASRFVNDEDPKAFLQALFDIRGPRGDAAGDSELLAGREHGLDRASRRRQASPSYARRRSPGPGNTMSTPGVDTISRAFATPLRSSMMRMPGAFPAPLRSALTASSAWARSST